MNHLFIITSLVSLFLFGKTVYHELLSYPYVPSYFGNLFLYDSPSKRLLYHFRVRGAILQLETLDPFPDRSGPTSDGRNSTWSGLQRSQSRPNNFLTHLRHGWSTIVTHFLTRSSFVGDGVGSVTPVGNSNTVSKEENGNGRYTYRTKREQK